VAAVPKAVTSRITRLGADEFTDLYREELPTGNDPLPPIGCVEDRDGRHRVAARRRVALEYPGRGYDELPAETVRADQRDPIDYAYELAIGCSAVSSKQLRLSEWKAAAKRLSQIRPDLTAREIGTRLGISHQTVLRARGSIAVTGGGSRLPLRTSDDGDEPSQGRSRTRRRVTLEDRAYQAISALCQLLDQALDESRGMLGLGKPNMARAGAAAYKALEASYGEDAPAVTRDLFERWRTQ
jgi:hypothetical protein